jgi:hypothetical protein
MGFSELGYTIYIQRHKYLTTILVSFFSVSLELTVRQNISKLQLVFECINSSVEIAEVNGVDI